MSSIVSATVGQPFSGVEGITPLRLCKRISRAPGMGLRPTFFGIIANRGGMWISFFSGPAWEAQPEIMRRAALAASRSGARTEIVAGLAQGASDRDATIRAIGGKNASLKVGKCSYRVSRDGEVTAFPAQALNRFSRVFDSAEPVSRGVLLRLAEAFYKAASEDPDLVDQGDEDFDAAGDSEPWRPFLSPASPITRFVGPGGGGKTRLIASLFGVGWQLLPESGGPGLMIENDCSTDHYRMEISFRQGADLSVDLSSRIFDVIRSAQASGCMKLSTCSPHLSRLFSRKGLSFDDFFGRPDSNPQIWDSIVSSLNVALSESFSERSPEPMIHASSLHVLSLVRDQVISLPYGAFELTAEGDLVRFRYATSRRSSLLSALKRFSPRRGASASFYSACYRIRIAGPFIRGAGSFCVADDASAFADRSLVVEKAIHAGDSSDLAMAASRDGSVFSALTMFDETPDLGVSGHEVRRLKQAWATIPGGEASLRRFPPFRFGGLFHGAKEGILKCPKNEKEATRLFSALAEPGTLPDKARDVMIRRAEEKSAAAAETAALRREIGRLRERLMAS